jgi:hypothetical protein
MRGSLRFSGLAARDVGTLWLLLLRSVRYEPRPLIPLYRCEVKGLKTTPMTGTRFMAKPSDMLT